MKFNKYVHTILDRYNNKLMKYSAVLNKDGISDREKYFNNIKLEVQKEFDKFNKLFLMIHIESDFFKQKERTIITYNDFNIVYRHNGYDSRLDVSVTEVISNKLIYLGLNCMILKEFDKDTPFIKILAELAEQQKILGLQE